VRILGFGYDTNLLLPEDEANEGQYRQRRYCDLLGQEKAFIILGRGLPHQERSIADGRIWAISASAQHKLRQVGLAYLHGIRVSHRFQPDIVEYQDPGLAGLVAYLTARRLRVPLVGGVFNDFLDNPTWLARAAPRRLYNVMAKFVLSRSVRVRCDSLETACSLNTKGYTQVRYVPFFVPWLEGFSVSDEVQSDRLRRWDSDPVILCVARLSEEKNIALLLRAFERVHTSARRGRLVFVGAGPLKRELERLAAELGVERWISWVGAVEYRALPGYYRQANLLVLPSSSETLARVLVLAQASRLPVITTDTSGSRGVVSNGQSGYVTPVGDVQAFSEALGRLICDKAIYRRMLGSTGAHALEQHGEAMITGELRGFYEDVLPCA